MVYETGQLSDRIRLPRLSQPREQSRCWSLTASMPVHLKSTPVKPSPPIVRFHLADNIWFLTVSGVVNEVIPRSVETAHHLEASCTNGKERSLMLSDYI